MSAAATAKRDRHEDRGVRAAPCCGQDGETVLLAITSRGRLLGEPRVLPHKSDYAAAHEEMWDQLDALDPVDPTPSDEIFKWSLCALHDFAPLGVVTGDVVTVVPRPARASPPGGIWIEGPHARCLPLDLGAISEGLKGALVPILPREREQLLLAHRARGTHLRLVT